MDSIMLPAALDVKNVQFGTPRTNDNGGKSIYLSFNKAPIVLQTPEMYAPFGMSKYDNDNGSKYSIDLSFKGMESRKNLETFYEKMNELDEKLIDEGVTNSFDWLKKKGASRDVVKALYTKLVRHPIDKETGDISTKYPPTFKLSLPQQDGVFKCDVYDGERNVIDLNTVETKGAKITAIIQCLGVWVAAGKFGCTWKVIQMKVVPPASIRGYAFKEVANDAIAEDVEDEVAAIEPPTQVTNNKPVDEDDGDDDNDFVESSDDELETKKPVAAKKKVTAAKK
jgi:hypothetical protein